MKRHNGGIVGKYNTTSASSARGRFTLPEIQEALLNGTWPLQIITADYLVIAGGGGGGADNINGTQSGGGGAGGFLTGSLTLTGSTVYTITVGAGGSGAGGSNRGGSGSNSVLVRNRRSFSYRQMGSQTRLHEAGAVS